MQPTMPRFGEFVTLIAMLSSLTALSIDAMLPALAIIGQDLHVQHANEPQLIISTLFVGMVFGQIVVGPLSDAYGRKPLMYAGLIIFMLGSLVAMLAQDFSQMLLGRFLQGLGTAAPRILTMALVRDCYAGRGMARVLSFTMSIFVLVPMIAPSLGQAILLLASWRSIFSGFLLLAVIVAGWFWLRMPETLPADKRRPLNSQTLQQALRETLTTRSSMMYMLTAGLVFGVFLSYLSSSQQILQIQYRLGEQFPLYFAVLAFSVGGASFLNARLVMHYGMRWLSHRAILAFTLLSAIFWVITYQAGGQPSLTSLMVYLSLAFVALGIMFGNLNALAMEPLGHIAGIAASVIGSLSTLTAIPLGILIGQSYDGTVLPLVTGFFLLGLAASVLMLKAEAH
ncbi:MAG TPA: multidrug effflux MFS transporter [Candidatus Thiothrix moscowensis]|uniref:multidrug effflux MFS transporter n=2 Tax=Thiothrix TaxID=1030 RepID=UPI0025E986E5|nr:multidrug effflux MFS transporter [Thiothrix sp. UBA2332]HRJ52434.1 multidrug effflux MFS transporter [Candidatus Thiothrix moscowensis]HRJ93380.1 multidrug effflux MFS transporter [Candidatus Thiothrix moscowensis]